jgi:hypothetical protein
MSGNYTCREDKFYGDTQLINTFQNAGYEIKHLGWGDFIAVDSNENIEVSFFRVSDGTLMKEQVGRLHVLYINIQFNQFIALLDTIGASRQDWIE